MGLGVWRVGGPRFSGLGKGVGMLWWRAGKRMGRLRLRLVYDALMSHICLMIPSY